MGILEFPLTLHTKSLTKREGDRGFKRKIEDRMLQRKKERDGRQHY